MNIKSEREKLQLKAPLKGKANLFSTLKWIRKNYAELILSSSASNDVRILQASLNHISHSHKKASFQQQIILIFSYIKIYIFQLIYSEKETILSSSKTFNNFIFYSFHFTILKH